MLTAISGITLFKYPSTSSAITHKHTQKKSSAQEVYAVPTLILLAQFGCESFSVLLVLNNTAVPTGQQQSCNCVMPTATVGATHVQC